MNPLASPPVHLLRGALLMIAAVCVFALLDTTSKYLARDYPVAAVVWARYLFQTVLMIAVLVPRGGWSFARSRAPRGQIARGVLLAIASLAMVEALKFMPIAEASALVFTSPLIVTALSVPLLRERVRASNWFAVALGFAGTLFIVRPGSGLYSWFALIPFAAAVFLAAYQVMTRKLAGVDRTLTALFYPGLTGTILFSLLLPFAWAPPRSALDAGLFVLLGILGGTGHFILIRALENAPAAFIAPLQYLQLVAAAILGYLVFGDFPDSWSLVGMAIIVACGTWVATRHRAFARR